MVVRAWLKTWKLVSSSLRELQVLLYVLHCTLFMERKQYNEMAADNPLDSATKLESTL